ncbi:MAG: hypothetical protein JWN48_2874 [Myxococcaceae bacterium]|nr:hypothetical protein [Myxococcaceae bacterium]
MKVGLLTTSFPRSAEDVPGNFVLGFASALARRGHQLEVLAPAPDDAAYVAPPELPNLRVHWIRYAPRALQRTFYGAGVLDNVRAEPLTALGLLPFTLALAAGTRARMPGWDAVISHWALPCALLAGELRGARPHLAVLHSADVFVLEKLPSTRLRRMLATRIARRADALLFSSRDLRRRFLALLGPLARAELAGRAHVCPMGIEPAQPATEDRTRLRQRLRLEHFSVLSLGRLITLKGIEHAIDAVARLPASELLICGDGPLRGALEQRAQQRGTRVRFLGNVFGAQKAELFRAADAFVLPSIVLPNGRTEGMPTTLLEAMEHGLPVVASDVGGVSDVVRSDENGYLVAPADTAALARALATLQDDTVRARLSTGAHETAALYHWSELAPRIERLLSPSLDTGPT